MAALRGLRSRAWAAVVVLVLVSSAAVAVELGAGLKVWRQSVGGAAAQPRAGTDVTPRPPSALVTVPDHSRQGAVDGNSPLTPVAGPAVGLEQPATTPPASRADHGNAAGRHPTHRPSADTDPAVDSDRSPDVPPVVVPPPDSRGPALPPARPAVEKPAPDDEPPADDCEQGHDHGRAHHPAGPPGVAHARPKALQHAGREQHARDRLATEEHHDAARGSAPPPHGAPHGAVHGAVHGTSPSAVGSSPAGPPGAPGAAHGPPAH